MCNMSIIEGLQVKKMGRDKWNLKSLGCTIAAAFILFFASGICVHAEEGEDWVEIVSVVPNHYENYKDAVTFTATVNYSLQSCEQGIVYLGFNTDEPNYYTVDENDPESGKVVEKGSGTVTLTKTVVPANWSSGLSVMQQFLNGSSYPVQDFKIYANITEYPHDIPFTPLAIYESVLTDLPETAPLQPEIFYGDSGNPSREAFDKSLEDFIKETSSNEYNPQLAHMLIALCNSVHNGENMRATFERMGFHDALTDYDMAGILLAYGMGKKQVGDETYVLIVARGTGDFSSGNKVLSEWMSNILDAKANDFGQHSGFSDAAKELYDRMMKFLGAEGSDELSGVKFIITGHSRGAAAANILAARLADEGISQENIYAYTFACPDTAVITKDKAESYHCIFNIGNVNDIVTWVPRAVWEDSGEKDGWGKDSYWDKYGNSFWYCEDWEDYESLHEKFTPVLSKIFDWVNKYHLQNLYLDFLRDEKQVDEYKNREQATEALRTAAEKKKENAGRNTMSAGEFLPTGDDSIISIGVFCPVDVMISDSDGNLLVSTTGSEGMIYESAEEKVLLSFFGDKKRIFVIGEERLDIVLVGTGEGVMQFSISSGNTFQEAMEEEKKFEEVEVHKGKTMHCVLNSGAEIEDTELFLVDYREEELAKIMTDGTEETLLTENIGNGKADAQEQVEEKAEIEKGKNDAESDRQDGENGSAESDSRKFLYYIIICESAVIVLVFAVIAMRAVYKRKKRD